MCEQIELFRKRQKRVGNFRCQLVKGTEKTKTELRIMRGEEEEGENRRRQAANSSNQAQPTQGDFPEEIAIHVRLAEKTCLTSITLTSVGRPYPLKRLQLMKLIEHYGGRFISMESADETTDYIIIGKRPYIPVMDAIEKYNLKTITQNELFDVVKGRINLGDVDRFLQEQE